MNICSFCGQEFAFDDDQNEEKCVLTMALGWRKPSEVKSEKPFSDKEADEVLNICSDCASQLLFYMISMRWEDEE